MKRALLTLVAVAALAVGAFATRADAHNFDQRSLFVCAATRPDASYTINHSWPVLLTSGSITERCSANNASGFRCWEAIYWIDSNTISRSSGYYSPCPWAVV